MESLGGPIRRLVVCSVNVQGITQYQVNAFLRPDLLRGRPACKVFSAAAGTGTASTPMVARYKAIAEAMERWAYLSLTMEGRGKYGLEIDPSSNGFAAFPGWRARQAREAAYWEAVERFGIMAWWEGRATGVRRETEWPGVEAVTISAGLPGATVVVFRRQEDGTYAYGQASRPDYEAACRQAAVELERHGYVVRHYLKAVHQTGFPWVDHSLSLVEQRCLYFAREEGHRLFQQRLARSSWRPADVPRLAYDGPVPGPWTQFADVWRVVITPTSRRPLEADHTCFHW